MTVFLQAVKASNASLKQEAAEAVERTGEVTAGRHGISVGEDWNSARENWMSLGISPWKNWISEWGRRGFFIGEDGIYIFIFQNGTSY